MNFIGHLAIARAHAASPEFWLGAMLPDLASMAGVRLQPGASQSPLAEGVAHHHAVDDVFHGTGEFVALMRAAVDALSARGLPRGAARAVAHIGVELLIDGELEVGAELGRDYAAALGVGSTGALHAYAGALAGPLTALLGRLISHGYPFGYGSPARVASLVVRILAPRPSLAVPDHLAHVLPSVLAALQPDVRRALPGLLGAVHTGLVGRTAAHNER